MKDTCPDISILSSFLDGELTNDEKRSVRVHTENCSVCAARLNRMTAGDKLLLRSLRRSMTSGDQFRARECVSPEAMTSYLHDLLSASEKATVESHLDLCDGCLSELRSLAKSEAQLKQVKAEPLPDSLRKKMQDLWTKEQTKEPVLHVAVRLCRDGIEILRDTLFPEAISFQEIYAAAGAYRDASPKGSLPSGVLIRRTLPGTQLSLLIQREKEDRASIKIKIEDEKSNPLESQRIRIYRNQVLLQSERTDADGAVVISNLERGAYQLGINILEKEFYVGIEINEP